MNRILNATAVLVYRNILEPKKKNWTKMVNNTIAYDLDLIF